MTTEYLPPCFTEQCSRYKGSEAVMKPTCLATTQALIESGGAGLIEGTICSMGALAATRLRMDEPEILEIRTRMGLTEQD